MKNSYLIVSVILLSLTVCSCTNQNKQQVVASKSEAKSTTVRKSILKKPAKCCASNIPARF